MFLTVSMEPLSSAVCDVCSQPLLDRPYIMCQRCTTSIHMACSGKQTSNACESLPDQSSFEIVERIDEALKDKVARIEHLTSQIKEEVVILWICRVFLFHIAFLCLTHIMFLE